MVKAWLLFAIAMWASQTASLLQERAEHRNHWSWPIPRVRSVVDHNLILLAVGRWEDFANPLQVARTFDGLRESEAMLFQQDAL